MGVGVPCKPNPPKNWSEEEEEEKTNGRKLFLGPPPLPLTLTKIILSFSGPKTSSLNFQLQEDEIFSLVSYFPIQLSRKISFSLKFVLI